jgi:hypothetical protein
MLQSSLRFGPDGEFSERSIMTVASMMEIEGEEQAGY